jgi:hypothetical protein
MVYKSSELFKFPGFFRFEIREKLVNFFRFKNREPGITGYRY